MTDRSTTAKIDDIARECLSMRLRAINRVVTGLYDQELRTLGLKASQLNILVAASKFGLASPLAVCRMLHLDPSTLSRNVDRMRARGWLEIVPGGDGREHPFRLTEAGHKLLARAVPHWKSAQRRVSQHLGDDLVRSLDKIAARLNAMEEEP